MKLLKYVLKIDTGKQIALMILVAASVFLGFANVTLEGRIIDDAIDPKPWMEISNETLEKIKNDVTGEKLRQLEGMVNRKVSKENLLDELRALNFTDKETGIIIKNAKVIENPPSLDRLFKYIFAYFLVMLIARLFEYISEILFMQVSQKTLIKLRTELYNHIIRLNIAFFHKTPIGEVMSRIIPEVQQLGMLLSQIILVPLNCGITILMGIGLVTAIDWKLGVISIFVFSLVFIFLPKLRAKLKSFTQKWSEKMRDISVQAEDSVAHYMEIQSNNTFAYEEEKLQKSLYEFLDINVDIGKVHGQTSALSQVFSSLATLSVYGVGGWFLIKYGTASGLSVGAIFIMIRALGTIITPINRLIDFSQRYQEAIIKFDMIYDYLNIPQEMVDKKDATDIDVKGKIEAKNVSFGFEPSKMILKDINLDIKAGEHVALVGPAGCGKSTLSLLINRMMSVKMGEIKVDDTNILDIKLSCLRKHIGYVAQAKTNTPVLFGGSLADNIIYSLKRKEGNSSKNPGDWLDLEAAGIKDLAQLKEEILDIIKDVKFYEDVYNFGLRNVTLLEALKYTESIFRIEEPEAIRKEVLKGRKKIEEKIKALDENLIEIFDSEKFLNYSSILENIIFTSAEPFLKEPRRYEALQKVLVPVCEEAGIHNRIFETGCQVAGELSDIFKRVKPDNSQLLRKVDMPPPKLKAIAGIGEKYKRTKDTEMVKKGLPPPALATLYRLGFEYSAGQGLDINIEEDFKEKILKARKLFKEKLTSDLKSQISFYDKENYIDGATIRENLILGKINTLVPGADEKVSSLIKDVIKEVELEDEIISLGLLMDIGERGAKLSGGQAQKAAISRVLLKKPSILILDEATSALDNASQQKINEMLQKRFKDKTVITIAHRLDTIKDYNKIVVLRAGEIVESGTFTELQEKKGLFFQLWESLSTDRSQNV